MRKQREMRIFPIHHWNPLKRTLIMSFLSKIWSYWWSCICFLINFVGNFGISLLLSNLSFCSHRNPTLPRDQSSECQNPDNTARTGGSNDSEGHKSWVRWIRCLAKWFETFGTLVFFCFFHVLFFVLELSVFFCWGDVNNFLGDVYLNCLRDWFTSHYTGPGSLTVTCYMTCSYIFNGKC